MGYAEKDRSQYKYETDGN